MKKKTIIILLILTLSIFTLNINVQNAIEENDFRPISLKLTPHDSIFITNDSGFEVFPGTGTIEDPYIIEGYDITTSNTCGITNITKYYAIGIYIAYTTKCFVISSCYVDVGKHGYGICIDNVADGTATITDNTCENNQVGIVPYSSNDNTLSENTCSNNYYGIQLRYSNNNILSKNTCENNNWEGIVLYSSYNNILSTNTCENNRLFGIGLSRSGGTILTNNIFINNGLSISESNVEDYLSYTIEDNKVNGKLLGFYTNLFRTTLDKPIYGQLILINCTEVVVSNQELFDTSVGLILRWCKSTTITNNICSNNLEGIWVIYSSGCTLTYNTCSNNNGGIWLGYSTEVVLTNNVCSNNMGGIFLDNSNSCLITYNLLQENERSGIVLGYGFRYPTLDKLNNNILHHNNFVDNNQNSSSPQAWDHGTNNTWYDPETLEGNYWSDYSGNETYTIGGISRTEDLYPLNEPAVYITPSQSSFALFTFIVPLILIGGISLNRKRKQYN